MRGFQRGAFQANAFQQVGASWAPATVQTEAWSNATIEDDDWTPAVKQAETWEGS